MKLNSKKIAFVLSLILSINALPLNVMADAFSATVLADSAQNANNADILSDEFGLDITDSVASGNGIAFNDKLTYSIVPIDISEYEDYIIDYAVLSDAAKEILEKKYSKLDVNERKILQDEIGVRSDTMLSCQSYGYNMKQSIPIALIMQRLKVDIDAALIMISNYKSVTLAEKKTLEFKELQIKAPIMLSEKNHNLVNYVVAGYELEEICDAFVTALCTESEITDIIAVPEIADDIVSGQAVSTYALKAVGLNTLNEAVSSGTAVEAYLKNKNLSETEFEQKKIKTYAKIGLAGNNVATCSSTSTNQYTLKPSLGTTNIAPFSMNNIGENVDVNTGRLYIYDKICSLPGLNGLDLNLGLRYSSQNDVNIYNSRINVTSNWEFTFSKLIDFNGNSLMTNGNNWWTNIPAVVTLNDGSSYSVSYDDSRNTFQVLCGKDNKLELCYDKNSAGHPNSEFSLKHKDGSIEYFDCYGYWLKVEDRFGNAITSNYSDGTFEITDTKGQITTITKNGANSQVVVLPDGETITYTYEVSYITLPSGSTRRMRYLSSKIDSLGKTTRFKYVHSAEDSYKTSLLTEVSYPSGLTNYYQYEWDGIFKANGERRTDKKFARVINSYSKFKNDNTVYNNKTYSYSSNYTSWIAEDALYCDCPASCCVCRTANDPECVLQFVTDEYGTGATEGMCLNTDCETLCLGNWGFNDWTNYYNTTVTDNKGLSTTYYYKSNSILNEIVLKNNLGQVLRDKVYSYDQYNKHNPKSIVTTEGGLVKKEAFVYDVYGNITSYEVYDISAGGSGTLSYKETNTYTFNDTVPISFSVPTESYVYRDAQNSIITKNTFLTGSAANAGKVIANTKTYESNALKSRTDFTYTSATGVPCILNKVRNYVTDTTYIDTNYTYNYLHNYSNSEVYENVKSTVVENRGTSTVNIINETQYDIHGREQFVIDPNGNKTMYEYDANDNLTKVSYVKNGTSYKAYTNTYNYDANTCETRGYLENGTEKVSIRYTYNPAGNLTKVEDLKNNNNVLETYTYDNSMRLLTHKEGKALTAYTYDYYDRVLTEVVKDATNTSQIFSNKAYSYALNNAGWLTTETVYGSTAAENIVNSSQNNIMGQTVSRNVAGDITNYTYDFIGNVLTEANKITNTVYLTTSRTYNHDNQVLSEQIVDPDGETTVTSYTYDMLGRMTSSADAKNNVTNYQYYSTDKVVKKSYPIGTGDEYADINYTYDAAGNLVQESDGITSTTYTYDFKNRLIKEQRDDQYTTYTYDLLDNLLETRNAKNAATTYTYDQLNRCKTVTDALGKTETFTYNNYGDIISKKDRNGNTITYTSDALHRNLMTSYGTNTITRTYNLNGNIKSEQSGNATKQYTYNSKGLLANDKTTVGSKEFNIQKQYDSRGNYLNVKYLIGSSVVQDINYTWDNRNRMRVVRLKDNSTSTYSEVERYFYDANNNLTTKITDNGITATYVYDKANRVKSLSNKKGTDVVSSYAYTYFNNGFISSETDNTGASSHYTYNTAGNLVGEVSKLNGVVKQSKRYIYDKAGNRDKVTATGENPYTQHYFYDNNNRLTSEVVLSNGSNTAITHKYTYDNNGNRISVEKMAVGINQGQHAKLGIYEDSDTSVASKDYYTYNELNQLTSVRSIGDSRNYRYAYLPNGLRYYKTDGTNYDYMYYDGDQICARAANANNGFTHYYVFGLGRIKDNYGSHYVYNSHGDVTKLTNASGAVTKSYDYDAFGVESDKQQNDTNPFRYCGEYYDTETDLIYLRARYYDPGMGGFITEDPIRDGVNWYRYCAGNPINFIDPTGSAYIRQVVGYNPFSENWGKVIEYRLEKETMLLAVCKASIQTLPFGDVAVWLNEKSFGIIGGPSSTSANDVFKSEAVNWSVDKATSVLGLLGETAKGAFDIYGYVENIKSSVASAGMVKVDDVAFDIMDKFSIATRASSPQMLENNLYIVYDVIGSDLVYFYGDFFNESGFEMDYKIYSSKNPEQKAREYIDLLINRAAKKGITSGIELDNAIDYINGWEDRINQLKLDLSGTTKQ